MSNPIELQYSPGKNLYSVIHNPDGRVWNTNTTAWEAYNSAHWLNYAVTLTEQSQSGYYRAAYPIDNVDVLTTEASYEMTENGSTPALGDVGIGVGQSQGVDTFAIRASVAAGHNLSDSADSMERGTVLAGANSATQVVTDLSGTVINLYAGRVVIFTTGDATRAARIISGFDPDTGILTFDTLPVAPGVADAFIVV